MSNIEEKFWDELYTLSTATNMSPFAGVLKQKIYEAIPPDVKTVLDVGCGSGGLMEYLARSGRFDDVQGVDFSSVAVDYINTKLKLKAQTGDVTHLINYPDDSFDLVICSEVTEHLPPESLIKALEELTRVTKKYLIISNPHKEKLVYYQVKCHKCITRFHPAGHIHSVDEGFIPRYLKYKAKDIKFYYSGKRELRSLIFGQFLRMMQWHAFFPYPILCPCCRSVVKFNKLGIFGRLMISSMRRMQQGLKKIGLYECPNNIITLYKV